MPDRDEQRPLVFVRPPLVFLGGLVGGYVARLFLGGEIVLFERLLEGIGLGFIIAALWLFFSAAFLFAETGEELQPDTGSRELIRTGPFRRSRNPIYLAMVLFTIGIALATGNPWMLLAAALIGVILHFLVILPEERYLEERFGSEYTVFKRSVRRWV